MKKRTRIDFTGLYSLADPFDADEVQIIDCTALCGCTMYVDESAEEFLRSQLSKCDVNGIHFLDNGNYHYVTRFFLERIVSPFSLLVFDNHTDDKKPVFEGIRSCGSWIRDVKEDLKETLTQVVLVQGKDKVRGELTPGLPVYVSIDLDVLSVEELKVNWDQGDMLLPELAAMLLELVRGHEILGVDICGGCLPEESGFLKDNKRVFNELYKIVDNELFGEA